MKPWIRMLVVVAVFQGAALLVYRERAEAPPPTGFSVQRLDTAQVAPALELERRSGEVVVDGGAPRWRVIHFWATWCPPCKRELPGLLTLARTAGALEVVPVAVDREWRDVDRFFAGAVPPEIVRLRNEEATSKFGVTVLPDSYLVSPAGVIVARMPGERVWDGAEARAALEAAVAEEKRP